MKKYEAMEAIKVSFNSEEQIASAACDFYLLENGGKYDWSDQDPLRGCEFPSYKGFWTDRNGYWNDDINRDPGTGQSFRYA